MNLEKKENIRLGYKNIINSITTSERVAQSSIFW